MDMDHFNATYPTRIHIYAFAMVKNVSTNGLMIYKS